MKEKLVLLAVGMILVVSLCGSASAQRYSHVKLTFKDGALVEGKKGWLTKDYIDVVVNGASRNYSLQDIDLIMGKKNRVGIFALGGGGIGLVIGLVATALNPDPMKTEMFYAGTAILTIIGAGLGAIAGTSNSRWVTVYDSGRLSFIPDRFDLTFSSYQEAPCNIGVVYKLK